MMQISKEQKHAASVVQDAYQFWLPAGLEKIMIFLNRKNQIFYLNVIFLFLCASKYR